MDKQADPALAHLFFRRSLLLKGLFFLSLLAGLAPGGARGAAAPPTPTPSPAAARLAAAGVREIVFAARQIVNEHWYANFSYYAVPGVLIKDFGSTALYRDGAKLYRQDLQSGRLTLLLDDPRGTIRDPQVNYEGTKILFAYRKGGTLNLHLYEINIDGSGLRQLTDGPYDDFEPAGLPDGGIVFVSSRCERWVNCWSTQVATLYRCDGEGKNIRPLSSNNEQDNTPWPLADGRILYTRWEYVDRSQVHYHHLWSANPDGTGQMVYFGNLTSGTLMIDAKPVPGTDKIVASFSPGHGRFEHTGYVTIVSPKQGPDDNGSARRISNNVDLHDPWAFSEDCIMAAFKERVVLLNGKGEMQDLARLPAADQAANLAVHEPRPLLAHPREPRIPARVDLTTATGRMVLANVYEGRNMAGVKPGEIKKLLLLETLPMPVHYSGGMEPITSGGSFTLERILGTVPVEADGSAYFELPALRSVFFVALDGRDLSVKRMQSFTSVEPGETLGCVGCHESRVKAAPPRAGQLLALRRPPSRIEPIRDVPEVIDFPRDIQPILDRHCVRCHGNDAGVDLTGDRGPIFSQSYLRLSNRRMVADGRNEPQSNYAPRTLGSAAAELLRLLEPTNHGIQVSEHEKKMVRLWIESGAPYPGTYAAVGTGMIGRYEGNQLVRNVADLASSKAAWEAIGRRCAACHAPGERELPRNADHDLPKLPEGQHYRVWRLTAYNLTHPEASRMLRAPLARQAGGLGSCRVLGPGGRATGKPADVFASTSDPDYQTILTSIEDAKKTLDTIKRFDMPGFRPRAEWVREMKRYGILPADLPDTAPIDPYATERKYWESLWWRPEDRSNP